MNNLPWICPACRSTIAAGVPGCPECGCPEGASGEVVDQHMRQCAVDPGLPVKTSQACPKCTGDMSIRGELRGSAGGISAVFELSNARFHHVSCASCGYTEFYRSEVSALGQLTDLLIK